MPMPDSVKIGLIDLGAVVAGIILVKIIDIYITTGKPPTSFKQIFSTPLS